jgi:hypothetical protein
VDFTGIVGIAELVGEIRVVIYNMFKQIHCIYLFLIGLKNSGAH